MSTPDTCAAVSDSLAKHTWEPLAQQHLRYIQYIREPRQRCLNLHKSSLSTDLSTPHVPQQTRVGRKSSIFAHGLLPPTSRFAWPRRRSRIMFCSYDEYLTTLPYFRSPTPWSVCVLCCVVFFCFCVAGNATAVMGHVDQALIDRVFSATRLLNGEAMQHFVEQLIQVRHKKDN